MHTLAGLADDAPTPSLTPTVGQTKGRHYVAGLRFPENVLATAPRQHTIANPYAP